MVGRPQLFLLYLALSIAIVFNGDGLSDLVIGAPAFQGSYDNTTGLVYVVFGGGNVGTDGILEASGLDGDEGFIITGIPGSNRIGNSVSGAGDINGDGLPDIIIGAAGSISTDDTEGLSYVIFGGAMWVPRVR